MGSKKVICALAAAASVTAGWIAAAPTPADELASETTLKRIAVRDNFFNPLSVSVQRGTRVRWVWRGENSHNVTFVKIPKGASDRGANSRREGRFTRTFWRRGVYKYVCTLHDGMRGTIFVGYQGLL